MAGMKIPPHGRDAFRTLASLGVDHFVQVTRVLLELERPSIRPSSLYSVVYETSGDISFSRAFCTLFLSLAMYGRTEGAKPVQIVAQFRAALLEQRSDSSSEENQSLIAWFDAIQDGFRDVLGCSAITLPAKALDLSVDFDCVYLSGNVVADIRPVFDDGDMAMRGGVILQTLRLHYVPDGPNSAEREISLAIDVDDIQKLIGELERAKEKAKSLKDQFSELGFCDVFVVGEETYGFD